MNTETGTESNTDQSETTVSGRLHKFVMPVVLGEGKKWDRTIPFSKLSEELAERKLGQTLKQLMECGGVSPSEAIAIMEGDAWNHVSDKIGLEILNHIFYAAPKA